MKLIFILVGLVAVAVAAILIYKNNQKEADKVIDKVQQDAQKVADTASTVASDIKKA